MKKGFVTLERALSKLGITSRARARKWAESGRLKVNGVLVKDPQFLVIPEKDKFQLDGKPLTPKAYTLCLFYKPKGYVTTTSDEKGRKTIYDLLPSHLHYLHAVGRLDMHTTGLLLLTNSTRLSSYLTDPINSIKRVYLVSVKGEVTDQEVDLAKTGILDEGELLQAQEIEMRKVSRMESHLIVTLTEGKNREIRRMFLKIGHEVISLKRVSFGPWSLGELKPGEIKELTQSEIEGIPFI
jgi:23S rRNA pseudouridine2605 synthase